MGILYGDIEPGQSLHEKKIANKQDAFVSTFVQDLSEGIQNADQEIKGLERTEKDSIIFVSVFGTIGGLMVVALLAGTGFVIYKKKTGGSIKIKSPAGKKKIKSPKVRSIQ